MRVFVQVLANGEPAAGTVWTAPDGVQYRLWTDALDAPVGRALLRVTPRPRENLLSFENEAALVDWVVQDVLTREGRVVH
jgi:hypothetical protein